jgi:hypothetical protein
MSGSISSLPTLQTRFVEALPRPESRDQILFLWLVHVENITVIMWKSVVNYLWRLTINVFSTVNQARPLCVMANYCILSSCSTWGKVPIHDNLLLWSYMIQLALAGKVISLVNSARPLSITPNYSIYGPGSVPLEGQVLIHGNILLRHIWYNYESWLLNLVAFWKKRFLIKKASY